MKLSLDALKQKAGTTVSNELLGSISGGTEAGCHILPYIGPHGPVME